MFSENFILFLQVIASLMMGYDYFVAGTLKDRIDNWAADMTEKARAEAIQQVTNQFSELRKQSGMAFAIVVFSLGAYLSRLLMEEFSKNPQYLELLVVFTIIWLIFVVGLAYGIFAKLFAEHVAPMLVPIGKITIFSFLRFTPKGVIAGIGMLFLLTSFLCRFINYNYGI